MQAVHRALQGREKLWKVWWIWGIPVGWTASALTVFAELVRTAGYGEWGDLFDVVKLLVYFFWFRLAWRCSRNVDTWVWIPVTRFALSAGLVLVVLV